MKFAKELERDLVPEWRLKYLDYKTGKKKLKAINRALRQVNQTPRFRRRGATFEPSPSDAAPKYSYINRDYSGREATLTSRDPDDLRTLALANSHSQHNLGEETHGSQAIPAGRAAYTPEEQPLKPGDWLGTSYGSIIASPPNEENEEPSTPTEPNRPPPSLKLPGAALDPEQVSPNVAGDASSTSPRRPKTVTLPPAAPETDDAFKVGKTRSPNNKHSTLQARYKSVFSPKRMNSDAGPITQTKTRPSVRRLFSMSNKTPPISPGDVPLEAYRDLDLRQAEFFTFLDMELDKIEKFYKEKEEEATHRLVILRDQLHTMRDRRIDDIIQRQTAKIKAKSKNNGGAPLQPDGDDDHVENGRTNGTMNKSWLNPIDAALEAINSGKYGKSTKEITQLATPAAALQPQDQRDGRRDFARRPELPDVPYQSAKRKLKIALQEYYRGLELLKSYALLNRTAFRKISKKYDKTVHARPTSRYMIEKVNKAWFVNSEVIEGHIRAVEDLYARYFERGNHKVAVGKLRIKIARAGDYTENSFRNGLLLASGIILGVQGLIKASDIIERGGLHGAQTSYLLQLYAGYFLIDFLLILFCLGCRVWHETKINYVFIFEYDTRHHLDWRQLSELPCWCLFLLGLFMYLNFSPVGPESIYLYYPVMLLGIAFCLLFNPLRMFYFRTRMWLLYSLWRLLLAGIYPVEWRDFYLGDMFCSLTYSMGNIALFFCLYVRGWGDPGSCNSSHLRVIGFLTTLPGIWRALQCIRRYWDTGNKFPHLVNCAKYFATINFYMTLSIYRIDKNAHTKAAFITFATINSIYTSFWDIYYDWSLGDPHAKHRFLRKQLGYKRIWWYYTAMVIDPILRFNWVMYLVIPLQLQHSAVTAFCVSVSEILRRGMWSLFRVENEHCTNVGRFRASRDVPLPYDILPSPEIGANVDEARQSRVDEEQPISGRPPTGSTREDNDSATTTGAQLERARSRRARPGLEDEFRPSPLQRAFTHVGEIFRDAHAEDFERRRKPELGRDPRTTKVEDDESDDDSDADDAEHESGNSSHGQEDRNSDEEAENDEEESAFSRIREDLEVGMSGARGGRPSTE